MDADIVALRAPDELFDLPHPFSAAPDIGWPDLFNTGLMVLKPNMGDYYALLAMAQRSISFDGADQGLLNMHFGNTFNRLSFSYNVTPSAHYQYLPAYRHFQSSISMIHFIGDQKPWNLGREVIKGATPYCEAIGRWWSVYDRHFRSSVCRPLSSRSFSVLMTRSLKILKADRCHHLYSHLFGESRRLSARCPRLLGFLIRLSYNTSVNGILSLCWLESTRPAPAKRFKFPARQTHKRRRSRSIQVGMLAGTCRLILSCVYANLRQGTTSN